MAQNQAPSSTSFVSKYSYDVFLSFRGPDTRFGFTGNLYSALSQRGIFTFIDDEALRMGEEITPSLRKAIQESRISIIVFSKNYAFSTFCLDELLHIIQCHENQNMWILPVFYDVEPSQVRHQTGSYQEAFEKHAERFKDDIQKLQQWKRALRQAADLVGQPFKTGEEYESKIVKKITEEISTKLNRPLLHIADYPVGLKDRMKQIQELMGGEFDKKVTMLGIHGMGGIGKSTLSRAMYNLMAHQFEASHFLANVREKSSDKDGLVHIQETILSKLVGVYIKLGDVHEGIPILEHRLCGKKVLLVLDDISEKEQLRATAGGLHWFGPGSIIIITTRNKQLLDVHGVQKLYMVGEMNHMEALKLFKWNAFKNKEVDPCFKEVIKRAVCYVDGLPLALETIGSNLFGKSLDEWESALETYERIPNRDVEKVLKVSYDSLEVSQQEIFLDIACFFRGRSRRYVTNTLEARGVVPPHFGLKVLEEKSLIKFRKCPHETVEMHDMIRCMGKEIVRQQSTLPRKRNRLWFYEDIKSVLEKNKENDKIEAMMLKIPEHQEEMQLNLEFGKIENLKMLLVEKKVDFHRSPATLPNSLRVLEWPGCLATSLPHDFQLKNLVLLDLSYSEFAWDKPLENSKVLRHLILVGCKNIRQIPDISGFPNLTKLRVGECINLFEIHDSVGSLLNLKEFCAEGCTKLRIGPSCIKSISLEHLCFRGCSSLDAFPEVSAPEHKLKRLELGGTGIRNLPDSMKNLVGIEVLSLGKGQMPILRHLPIFFPNLHRLYLRNLHTRILPARIEECYSLKFLRITNCKKLQEIRGFPLNIESFIAENCPIDANSLKLKLKQVIDSIALRICVLPGLKIPEFFDYSDSGNSIPFWFRKELPFLAVCATIGVWDNVRPPFTARIDYSVIVKENFYTCVCCFGCGNIEWITEDSHIIIVNLRTEFHSPLNSDVQKALLTKEWIRGRISLSIFPESDSSNLGEIRTTGVYVNRKLSKREDVQFPDPRTRCPVHRPL